MGLGKVVAQAVTQALNPKKNSTMDMMKTLWEMIMIRHGLPPWQKRKEKKSCSIVMKEEKSWEQGTLLSNCKLEKNWPVKIVDLRLKRNWKLPSVKSNTKRNLLTRAKRIIKTKAYLRGIGEIKTLTKMSKREVRNARRLLKKTREELTKKLKLWMLSRPAERKRKKEV